MSSTTTEINQKSVSVMQSIPDGTCTTQYINKSKVRDALVRTYPGNKTAQLCVSINQQVTTLAEIMAEPGIELSSYDITEQDLMILDAAYSLYQQGINPMSLDQIVQQYTGNPDAGKTEKFMDVVMLSIEKMRAITIKIDFAAEARYFKKANSTNLDVHFEGYLLPIESVTARYSVNGKLATAAYHMLTTPALYKYASGNRQIISVPAEYLQTSVFFSNTVESVQVKRYTLRRVMEIVTTNKLHNNRISLCWEDRSRKKERGLLPRLGITIENTPAGRKKRSRIIKIVKGTLEVLKEQGIITGYGVYRERNSKSPSVPIAGFEIYYAKEKPVTH